MEFIKTNIADLIIIKPQIFYDQRGWFFESYNRKDFIDNGISNEFKQDNHSKSMNSGILRGMHLQLEPYGQAKLIRCTKGKIFDVCIDLRKKSPTYLKKFEIELSEENQTMLYIPKGFAHGFLVLVDNTEVLYKVDNFYHKDFDRSIRYDDPDLNISWPKLNIIVSDKDKNAPLYKDSDVVFE